MIAWVRMLARIAAIRGAVGSLSGRKLRQPRPPQRTARCLQRTGQVRRLRVVAKPSRNVVSRFRYMPYLNEAGIWGTATVICGARPKELAVLSQIMASGVGVDMMEGPVTRKLCCGTSHVVPSVCWRWRARRRTGCRWAGQPWRAENCAPNLLWGRTLP
jgi:hypothetical protein